MQKLRCINKRKEEKVLGDSKTVMKSSGQNVDCDTMLWARQSFKQRDLQRKSLYFESLEEATIRASKRKAREEAGLRKKKRRSADPSSLDFDKAGLLQEVNEMNEGEKVRIN